MCGRGRCTLHCDDIPRACYRTSPPSRNLNIDRYRPSYNVSPGRDLPVVRREDGSSSSNDNGGYLIHCMKWGLVPSFTNKNEKPDHFKMFNARSESITEKASFRRLIPKSRCLVAFEGFYEWKKDGSKKQPYYIHFNDGRPLVFAALYDSWKNAEGELLYTFTILTTSSSSSLKWLHDRMPVILGDKGSVDTWLIGSGSSKFDSVLRPYEEKDLVWYPVTSAMGKPSFDGPECIKEIKLKTEDKNMISKFFMKKEQVVKQEEQCPDQFVQDNLQKGLKEESKSEDSGKHHCAIGHGEEDVKSNSTGLSHDAAEKGSVKREYEELSVDPDHLKGGIDKDHSNPVKKKREVSSNGDKQPTLLSYFRKR